MVPSGVWPLIASGPSATRSVHPASARTHALTSVRRASLIFHVCLVIGPPPVSHVLASPPTTPARQTLLCHSTVLGATSKTRATARIPTPLHRALTAPTSL